MDNNDVFRRIRYIFDYKDSKMIELFGMADLKVTRSEISNWLKSEDDKAFRLMTDNKLAYFLNGLIIEKRGKREGPQPIPEETLTNNIIFKKLKIALDLKTDDILKMFILLDKRISEHELSALFRNPKHRKYRECNDQYLRNFLNGIPPVPRQKN